MAEAKLKKLKTVTISEIFEEVPDRVHPRQRRAGRSDAADYRSIEGECEW